MDEGGSFEDWHGGLNGSRAVGIEATSFEISSYFDRGVESDVHFPNPGCSHTSQHFFFMATVVCLQ